MADREGARPQGRPEPSTMRSFLHGVRVSVVRVPFANGLPFKNADPFFVRAGATGVGLASGVATLLVGSPDQFHWNGPTDAGVGILGATAGSWVLYGVAKGGAMVARKTVEKGRRDLMERGLTE
jgi:hypothetical protein